MSAIDCIITAAGLSSRMGQWKMMLPWEQGTILDTSIKNALQFCSRIILVTGYRGNELHERYANQSNITIIHNPDYAQGLLTSVKAAVPAVQTEHCFLTHKEKGFISSTTIPVFKYLVDPQMLGVSNSMIYQLTDYIGYDILLQYIQELIQQARAMVATGNYDEAVIGHINDNMNDATRQIAAFQSQVQVQQDALLVVDRQMSYMRQQLSARMLSRYQNNYHFGGSTL